MQIYAIDAVVRQCAVHCCDAVEELFDGGAAVEDERFSALPQ